MALEFPIVMVIIFGIIALLVLMLVGIYNKLIVKRNNYHNSFAQIDTALMRRYDLIPNLVEVAKKYMEHERETLEAVIAARNQAKDSLNAVKGNMNDGHLMSAISKHENILNSVLGRLMAVVEAYPDLKANEQMQSLHNELSATENLIAAHRQTYNIDATEYNNYLQVFPNNVVGKTFGFRPGALYNIDEMQREAPKVQF